MKLKKAMRMRLPKYLKFYGRVYVRAPKGNVIYPDAETVCVDDALHMDGKYAINNQDPEQMQYNKAAYEEMVASIIIPNPLLLWDDTSKSLLKDICRDTVLLSERGVLTTGPFEKDLPIEVVFAEKLTKIFNDADDNDVLGATDTAIELSTALLNMKKYYAAAGCNSVFADICQKISALALHLIRLRASQSFHGLK